MNAFTTTVIVKTEEELDYISWQRCISDAVERYRSESDQRLISVSFSVKGSAEK